LEEIFLTFETQANVKVLCGIDAPAESLNTALNMCLTKADDFLNNAMEPYTSVPLSSPDPVVVDIAEFYAAGLYMQKNILDEKKHSYIMFAEEKPEGYIKNSYAASSGVRDKLWLQRTST
jgi:hypothetical protein